MQVNKATKDLDLFMRKDPPVLTMDEMRSSSTLIDKYALIFQILLTFQNTINHFITTNQFSECKYLNKIIFQNPEEIPWP